LFDRPLFGKRALWVKSAVSYSPDASKYLGSPYGPREPVELTHSDGHVIGEFIAAAVGRGAGWRYLAQLASCWAGRPLGFDRIVTSEADAPNMLADLV
jgi:hypothetical protein